MKKKFLAAFALCMGLMTTTAFAMEKVDVDLFYCGRDTKLDNPIYTENNDYFIPLRECAEQIGCTVQYVPNSKIVITSVDRVLEYHLADNSIFVNGIKTSSKSEIKNINGMSYINAKEFYEMIIGNFFVQQNQNGKTTLWASETPMKDYQKNDFSNSLSLLYAAQKNQNAALSPISVKLSLAMVANGTTGQTQQEILEVLGYNSLEELNNFVSKEALQWTVEERRTDKNFKKQANQGKIVFCNGLWYNNGDQKADKNVFSENFQNKIQQYFQGKVNTVTKDTAVQLVNEWVNQATNGMIPKMIEKADFETALINTTYFKCCWKSEFDAENTKKGTFYNIDNTQSEVDFMHTIDYGYYCETDGWQMAALPYSDGSYQMYLFLPNKDNTKPLDSDTINKLMQFQSYINVDITMPKFEIEKNYDLTQALKNMGISAMFQNNTDFNAMYASGEGKPVTDMLQKTKIIVNEQGTEAASGTFVVYMGMDMTKPPVFCADRPFTYMLTKKVNNQKEVLFIGQYVTGKE